MNQYSVLKLIAVFCLTSLVLTASDSVSGTENCSLFQQKNVVSNSLYWLTEGKSISVLSSDSHLGFKGLIMTNSCNLQEDSNVKKYCSWNDNALAFVMIFTAENDVKCFPLTQNLNDVEKDTEWEVYMIDDSSASQDNQNSDKLVDFENGLDFRFAMGAKGMKYTAINLNKNDLDYNLAVNVRCDIKGEDFEGLAAEYDGENRQYTLSLIHNSACKAVPEMLNGVQLEDQVARELALNNQAMAPAAPAQAPATPNKPAAGLGPGQTLDWVHYAGALAFLKYMGWGVYIAAPIIMIVAFYFSFFGEPHWDFTKWILGIIAFWSGSFIVLSMVLPYNTTWGVWTATALSIVISVVLSILFLKWKQTEKLFVALAGALAGYILGMILYSVGLCYLDK
jgi:hypothetical protein